MPSRLMARAAPSRSSASDRTCGRGLIELLNECTNNNVGVKPWGLIPARAPPSNISLTRVSRSGDGAGEKEEGRVNA